MRVFELAIVGCVLCHGFVPRFELSAQEPRLAIAPERPQPGALVNLTILRTSWSRGTVVRNEVHSDPITRQVAFIYDCMGRNELAVRALAVMATAEIARLSRDRLRRRVS